MSAAFIRLADSGAPWAKVQLREGDDVADVLTRACAEFTNWGTNASRASCFLVACTHGDKPSADAEAAALSGACLESTWPLLRAGVVPRSFLLVRPHEATTGAFGERRAAVLCTLAHPTLHIAAPETRVTLLLRSGRGTRASTLPYSFSSAADFAEFAKAGSVQRVSKNGVPLAAVRTLAEAQSGAADDTLRLTAPFDALEEDVSNLKGYRKSASSGHERATTLAMVESKELQKEFGKLSAVAKGESVVIRRGKEDVAEFDGLARNTDRILLCSAKHAPTEGDVNELVARAARLERILEQPAGYTACTFEGPENSVGNYELAPCEALEEMAGLTKVTPVLAGYDVKPPVLRACASIGVRVFSPNGVDYSLRRSLHTLARMVRLVR